MKKTLSSFSESSFTARFAFGTRQQILFTKRLALYLSSGIPISRALSYLKEDAHSQFAKNMFSSLIQKVEEGLPLSQGLVLFPHQFDAFAVRFIEAGEASGRLSETLEKLAASLGKRKALNTKLLSALAYPSIVLCGTIAISLFLTLFIFPKIVPILRGLKTQLPFTTRALIWMNSFIAHSWPELLAAVFLCSLALACSLRLRLVKICVESTLLRIPYISDFFRSYAATLFTRTLALQLSSGIGILSALSLVESAMPGILYAQAAEKIRVDVSQGQQLSMSIRAHQILFPLLISQMVAAGETTGTLSTNLSAVADLYEEQLDGLIKTSTLLMEPLLLVGMGVVVGFVALAIITPIYSLTQNLSAT